MTEFCGKLMEKTELRWGVRIGEVVLGKHIVFAKQDFGVEKACWVDKVMELWRCAG